MAGQQAVWPSDGRWEDNFVVLLLTWKYCSDHSDFGQLSAALLIINFITPETCVRPFGFFGTLLPRFRTFFSIYQSFLFSNLFIELNYVFLCQNCAVQCTHLLNSCNERVAEIDQEQGRQTDNSRPVSVVSRWNMLHCSTVLQCSSHNTSLTAYISPLTGGASFTNLKSQCFFHWETLLSSLRLVKLFLYEIKLPYRWQDSLISPPNFLHQKLTFSPQEFSLRSTHQTLL